MSLTDVPFVKNRRAILALSDKKLKTYLSKDSINPTTTETVNLQNENTEIVTDQKINASNSYQGTMNTAFERQASETTAAINAGTSIAAGSARKCIVASKTNLLEIR
jgi:beta-mannanase